jgi:hypothetical protein
MAKYNKFLATISLCLLSGFFQPAQGAQQVLQVTKQLHPFFGKQLLSSERTSRYIQNLTELRIWVTIPFALYWVGAASTALFHVAKAKYKEYQGQPAEANNQWTSASEVFSHGNKIAGWGLFGLEFAIMSSVGTLTLLAGE